MPPHLSPASITYNRLMANSFQRFTGESIVNSADTAHLTDAQLAKAMFDAPQAIVSHGIE